MDNNKTSQEIRQRKEESIRESTNNPKINLLELNGKSYNSFIDFLNSPEYKELLETEEQLKNEYANIAKEYFQSLDKEQQHLIFYYITNTIYENYFKGNSSYRGLLYDKLNFGPESYALGCDSGMFAIHNAISTPDELEERFNILVKYLNLNLPKKELNSLRNIFLFGFDTSKTLDNMYTGQQKFDF